jgi:acetyltransferase-like isoleucine patch superfamily enzyme
MTIREQFEGMRAAVWLRACTRIGEHPHLRGRPCVNVDGGAIIIGNRCTLSSRPVRSHFVAGPDAVLELGDDVSIGHGAAVAAYERVQIGSGTRIAPFVIIMDTNFHGRSGDQSVQHDCRPVIIGRDCRVGSRVTITRGASIGDGAEVLAGSVVSSSIPAGACAAGARARVIGDAGGPDSRWDSAAAMLPLLMMEALDMGTPPEMDDLLSDNPGWHETAVSRLLSGIEVQFGVRLHASNVTNATRVADLAHAVDRARRVRTGSRRI